MKKALGIYLHKGENIYFTVYSMEDPKEMPVWSRTDPVMVYRRDKLNVNNFMMVLDGLLPFSRVGLTEDELNDIVGAVLPSDGKAAFKKKCNHVSLVAENENYSFDASKRDSRGGFEYGYGTYEVRQDASAEEIFEAFNQAMQESIELDGG